MGFHLIPHAFAVYTHNIQSLIGFNVRIQYSLVTAADTLELLDSIFFWPERLAFGFICSICRIYTLLDALFSAGTRLVCDQLKPICSNTIGNLLSFL